MRHLRSSSGKLLARLLRAACIIWLCLVPISQAAQAQEIVIAPAAPALPDQTYPPVPNTDIPAPSGIYTYQAMVDAFNQARSLENVQLGLFLKPLAAPTEGQWAAMSEGERALWLINAERTARGLAPLHGLETNVSAVAQAYAQWLLDNNAWGHEADGRTPPERLNSRPAINACHDFLAVSENLFWTGTTAAAGHPFPVEWAVYNWMYIDADYAWGHRNAILAGFTENSGPADREGFFGLGHARGSYRASNGATYPNSSMIVMNVFDPCATWAYQAPPVVAPPPTPVVPPTPQPPAKTRTVSGVVTAPTWVTMVAQPFERDTWPGEWEVSDANGATNGDYSWIAAPCRVHSGEYSGMAVGGGLDGLKLGCGDPYPPNARSWMVYGPFSLADAVAAELRADVWVYTELDNDMLCLLASTDQDTFHGPCVSGYSDGWVPLTLDLNRVFHVGSLLGRNGISVALAFLSDESVQREHGGAYADNIVLRKGVLSPAQAAGRGESAAAAPLAGVTVRADSGQTAMTDQSGQFTLVGLAPGKRQLTPVLEGYQFYPPVVEVDLTYANRSDVSFVGSTSIHQQVFLPVARGR